MLASPERDRGSASRGAKAFPTSLTHSKHLVGGDQHLFNLELTEYLLLLGKLSVMKS